MPSKRTRQSLSRPRRHLPTAYCCPTWFVSRPAFLQSKLTGGKQEILIEDDAENVVGKQAEI